MKITDVVLTEREAQVLRLRMQNPPRSYTEIARELDLTTTRIGALCKALRAKGFKV